MNTYICPWKSYFYLREGPENYSFCKLEVFFLCLAEKKRNWREVTGPVFKDQLYVEFEVLQSVTDIISFLLLQLILLILQGITPSSTDKHGLEGWKLSLTFCLLPSLCSNKSPQEGSFRVCDLFRRHCGLLGRGFAFETAVHCS